MGGPKGEERHLSVESSILGSLCSMQFVFVMGQSNWLIAKKNKFGLVSQPQLINMKQNKYPQIITYTPNKGLF
jgi:hypothetical protein